MTEQRRRIEVIPIAQPPVQYVIFDESGKTMAGYCLITASMEKSAIIGGTPKKTAAIWHIYVEPKFRKLGYAKNLLDALKIHYDHIYSFAATDEGRKVMLNNGFARDKSGDTDLKMYRWRK